MDAVVIDRVGDDPEDIRAGLNRLVSFLGGWVAFVDAGSKVLIKPNLVRAFPPERAITTHPRVIDAVVDSLLDVGVAEITIGESSMVGQNTDLSFKTCGMEQFVEKNVNLLNLDKTPSCQVPIDKGRALGYVGVFSAVNEFDLIVNIPKLKSSVHTGISCAVKNLKGLIPDREKRRFHNTSISKAISDLYSVLPEPLSIVDGILALEGMGPTTGGRPKELGILAMSKNALFLDIVMARLIGMNFRRVPHLMYSLSHPDFDANSIPVLFEGRETCYADLPTLAFDTSFYDSPFDQEGRVKIVKMNCCSGCLGVLCLALARLPDAIFRKTRHLQIVIGTGLAKEFDPLHTPIFLGNCTTEIDMDKEYFVPGCTPLASRLERTIQEWVLERQQEAVK